MFYRGGGGQRVGGAGGRGHTHSHRAHLQTQVGSNANHPMWNKNIQAHILAVSTPEILNRVRSGLPSMVWTGKNDFDTDPFNLKRNAVRMMGSLDLGLK